MRNADEYPRKRYGAWAGNQSGQPYDPKRCAYEVFRRFLHGQCSKKCGHGPRELFCKQHAQNFPPSEHGVEK